MFRVNFSVISCFSYGRVWPGRVSVNNAPRTCQTHPAVAINEAGDFVVAWRSHPSDGRGGGVYARASVPTARRWARNSK